MSEFKKMPLHERGEKFRRHLRAIDDYLEELHWQIDSETREGSAFKAMQKEWQRARGVLLDQQLNMEILAHGWQAMHDAHNASQRVEELEAELAELRAARNATP